MFEEEEGEDADCEGEGQAEGADAQPKTVEQSNEELKKVRRSSVNTLHFTAMVLCSSLSCQQAQLIYECLHFIRLDLNRGIQQCHRRAGALERQCWLARGGIMKVLMGTMGAMHDMQLLERVGSMPHLGDTSHATVSELQREAWLAQRHFNLAMAVCKERLLSCMLCSDTLPGKFASLLDPSLAAETLPVLQTWWKELQAAEGASRTSSFLAKFLGSSI